MAMNGGNVRFGSEFDFLAGDEFSVASELDRQEPVFPDNSIGMFRKVLQDLSMSMAKKRVGLEAKEPLPQVKSDHRRNCIHPSVKESKEEETDIGSSNCTSGGGLPGLEEEVVTANEMEERCHHDHHSPIVGGIVIHVHGCEKQDEEKAVLPRAGMRLFWKRKPYSQTPTNRQSSSRSEMGKEPPTCAGLIVCWELSKKFFSPRRIIEELK